MYRLIRRISGSLTSRLEKVWWMPSAAAAPVTTGEASIDTSNTYASSSSSSSASPIEIGIKRRRSEADDQDEDVDISSNDVAKRSRVDDNIEAPAVTEAVDEASSDVDADADADADGDVEADTSALETLTQGTSEASTSMPSTPVKEKDLNAAEGSVKVVDAEEEENVAGVDGAEENAIASTLPVSSPVKTHIPLSNEVVPSSDNEDGEEDALEDPSSAPATASDAKTTETKDVPERIVPQSTTVTSAILVQ